MNNVHMPKNLYALCMDKRNLYALCMDKRNLYVLCMGKRNLYVLCMDKRNYPPLPKLVSKCSLRSTSLKLEKSYLLCKKDGCQFFASMFPSYFAETKKDKLRLQYLAECTRGFPARICECGWVVQDDCYRLKWYDDDASPTTVEDICHDDSENDICCSGFKG